MAKATPKGFKAFEKSGMDKDKGMKEGGKADMKADKKQFPAFLASKKAKAKK